MMRFLAQTLLSLGLVLAAVPALAQSADEPPKEVRELLRLLEDPAVREWVEQQKAVPEVAAAGNSPGASPSSYLGDRITQIRNHMMTVVGAIPALPGELAHARDIMMVEFQDRGIIRILSLIAGFLLLGYLVERGFRRITAGLQKWIIGVSLETVGDRLRAAGVRLSFGIGLIISFAVGSVGAFLAFDWPPLLREIVLGYLSAFLIIRTALVIARFLLAPGGERFRLVPLSTEAAWFWYWRFGIWIGWLSVGWVTVGLIATLGVSPGGRVVVAYTLGLVLLALGIEACWRRPSANLPAVASADLPPDQRRRIVNVLLTVYIVVLWLLWVASAMPGFWLLVAAAALPGAIRGTRRSVNHVLRPPGSRVATATQPSVVEVCLERGLRVVLIVGAALLLAHAWKIDFIAMTMQDTLATKLTRGFLSAIVIMLVAEFLWHFIKASIDGKLNVAKPVGAAETEETRRQSRLRTLLPILRNIAFIVILVVSVLMVLSSVGIEIGPLIAGAGVVGVAVGFGAQTLVKDVISGMFYLLDDAFRVGEYIQSGSYKGTVESFSLRSVKLRHHRGPLYTVPFGELGAVQNMSRDWVIDKLTIGVTYDTNLEKARKLIKDIGKELAANPEYAPHILEPLKMQGVEEFGDYAIQIRMKMMTKPGEQFVIRRKALALIRDTFDKNGIRFAQPTVQVAGGAENVASAAAKQMLNLATDAEAPSI